MPIDPSVLTPTLLRPISVAGVVDDAAKVQESRARADAWRQKSMEVARDQQENAQIQQLIREANGDVESVIPKVYQINAEKGGKLQQTYNLGQKAKSDLMGAQIDQRKKVADYALQALSLYDPQDPASWGHAQAALAATYHFAGLELPKEYQGAPPDVATMKRWQQSALSVKDQLEAQKKKLQPVEMVAGGQVIKGAFDPESGTYTAGGEDISVPVSEKTVDNARQAAKDVSDERHQNAMEAIARGNLGVALGNLNLRKQELAKGITGKPPTGAQLKTLGYFNRAKQASDDIDAVSDQIANMGLAGQMRMSYTPDFLNFTQSQLGQGYLQSQRAFTEARLRKDSGAAIPEQEFANDRRTYFVQPGDSKATIDQKTRARAAILASLGYESGGALNGFYGDGAQDMIEEYRKLSQRPAAGTTAAPKKNPNR